MDALSELMNLRIEVETLRARLAQPEPEQLGEIVPADEEQLKRIAKLVQPEPSVEPVAKWEPKIARMYSDDGALFSVKIKYTQDGEWQDYIPPSQRKEWVGLTDEEIRLAKYEFEPASAWFQFARAIEAKLKEKNNG